MAGVIEGEHALERAAIVPSVKRKSLKDPARKIWYEMLQSMITTQLASTRILRADYEAESFGYANLRIAR